jgi:hypothetical protein
MSIPIPDQDRAADRGYGAVLAPVPAADRDDGAAVAPAPGDAPVAFAEEGVGSARGEGGLAEDPVRGS